MSDGLAGFNSLAGDAAERRLLECFAGPRWAAQVAAGRPYADLKALFDAAEAAFSSLTPGEWSQAIASHPRIGERGGHAPASSEREQSRAMEAPAATLAALADENRRYEARFGHVFLISARGRSAEEILAEIRRRTSNDPAGELDEAARELRAIARARVERMLSR